MNASQRAAFSLFVEPVIRDIDGFLSGLSESRRGEAELAEIYRRMESGEPLHTGSPLTEIPSLAEMIRLVLSWRASAGKAAVQMPALDLADAAKAIRAELDSLEKAPSVPLDHDALERFPQHEEFQEFLQREEQAAQKVKVILEAIVGVVESPDNPPENEDGPLPGNRFHYAGRTHDLSPMLWMFLVAMWGHEERNMHDVEEEVWEVAGGSQLSDANHDLKVFLKDIGYPRFVSKVRRSDSLIWKAF